MGSGQLCWTHCGLWNVIGYCWALYSYLRFTVFYGINGDTDGPMYCDIRLTLCYGIHKDTDWFCKAILD